VVCCSHQRHCRRYRRCHQGRCHQGSCLQDSFHQACRLGKTSRCHRGQSNRSSCGSLSPCLHPRSGSQATGTTRAGSERRTLNRCMCAISSHSCPRPTFPRFSLSILPAIPVQWVNVSPVPATVRRGTAANNYACACHGRRCWCEASYYARAVMAPTLANFAGFIGAFAAAADATTPAGAERGRVGGAIFPATKYSRQILTPKRWAEIFAFQICRYSTRCLILWNLALSRVDSCTRTFQNGEVLDSHYN
jgi:hypothetical protein